MDNIEYFTIEYENKANSGRFKMVVIKHDVLFKLSCGLSRGCSLGYWMSNQTGCAALDIQMILILTVSSSILLLSLSNANNYTAIIEGVCGQLHQSICIDIIWW